MRQRSVAFRSSGILWVLKICFKKDVMFQYFWKNTGWKPSRPGAFKGLKEKIASLISMSERS